MIIDTNISLGNWPFFRYSIDTPYRLNYHLKKLDISTGFVSSIEAVLNRDIDICNKKLIKEVEKYPSLIPVVVISPLLANWEKRLKEYIKLTKIYAVKIYPTYHSYDISPEFMSSFMEYLKTLKIPLLIQIRIEDERTQFPAMQVPTVDINKIIKLALSYPENNIECLCPSYSEAVKLLNGAKNLFVDTSYIDKINALPDLIQKTSADRILFGSHTPFLYTESSKMKLLYKEISPVDIEKICSKNILSFLKTNKKIK